jgi:hypothetical protein
MAEIELSVYSRSLPKHVPNELWLSLNVEVLTDVRNQKSKSVNWQFRAADARLKLIKLYPSLSS